MFEWLIGPIDPNRLHDVGSALAWHGRLMAFAWGALTPLVILVTRFAKIWPGQNWPHELDNKNWWHIHWITHTAVVLMTMAGLVLVMIPSGGLISLTHNVLGYCVIALAVIQVLAGVFRGSKGGPTDTGMAGDHFDMTSRRVIFEIVHKLLGYLVVACAITAIISGLWATNAPIWMFIALSFYWITLAVTFVILQRLGYAVDTYQAIWGTNRELPGNRRDPIGWGIRRIKHEGK